MFLGYNTNGLAHHDLIEAIELLAEIGYGGVAITLDHGSLNPYDDDLASKLARVRQRLERHAIASVIETGARFLLDPRVKHEPTLMSADAPGRMRRVDFLCRAVDVAAELGSDCVSLWSGILRQPIAAADACDRLVSGLASVVAHAERRGVVVGFEPEPGMFIESMDQYARLAERLSSPAFRLTIDIGHLHCLGEVPIADCLHRFGAQLVNVHIEDMRAGVHEHLMFGEGEIDFPPIIRALGEIAYRRGVYVELSRHSHEGPTAAQRAFRFLAPLLAAG